MRHSKYIFMLMLLAGTSVRLVNLNQPLLEYNTTRQVQTAMIARNFSFGDARILYPEVDGRGKGPAYLMQELPIITYPVAMICRSLGSVPEWLLRSTSVIFFFFGATMFFLLSRKLFGDGVALIASMVFIFSPLSVLMSRTFQPDMLMTCFIIMVFYFLTEWNAKNRIYNLIFASAAFSGALCLKPINVYVLLPVLYVVFKDREKSGVDVRRFIIAFSMALLPALWWYGYHGPKVRQLFDTVGGINFNLTHNIESIKQYLVDPRFYLKLFVHIAQKALTPFIFLAFMLGLFVNPKGKKNGFLLFWLGSVIIFFLAFPEFTDHEYYKLAIIPVGAICAAKGIYSLFKGGGAFARMLIYLATLVSLLFSVITIVPYVVDKPDFKNILAAGAAMESIASKRDLVIASYGHGPALLYYCNRKGWALAIPGNDEKRWDSGPPTEDLQTRTIEVIKVVEEYRAKGARYFVVADTERFWVNPQFEKYMLNTYQQEEAGNGKYIIIDLEEKKL